MNIQIRTFCLFFLIIISVGQTFSQEIPTHSVYFINPYLYNPAETATNYTQVFADYRKQWAGIDGAPSNTTITFSTLLNETRMGIGGRFNSYKRGLLNTSEAVLSYAYGIPFENKSRVYFGVSGGIVSNSLDAGQATMPSDPAFSNFSSGIKPVASFGFLYRSAKGMNMSLALPKLINAPIASNTEINQTTTISPFNDMVFSLYYKKMEEPNSSKGAKAKGSRYHKKKSLQLPIEAYATYKFSRSGGQFELTGKVDITKGVWAALSYRQFMGVIPSIGFKINNLILGYAYEPGLAGEFPFRSHEFALSMRLGKEKKFKEKEQPVLIAKNNLPSKSNKGKSTTSTPVKSQQTNTAQPQNKGTTQSQDKGTTQPINNNSTGGQSQQRPSQPRNSSTSNQQDNPVVDVTQNTSNADGNKSNTPPGNTTSNPAANANNTLPQANTNNAQVEKNAADIHHTDHAEESKLLDQHLDEHDEGNHDDAHGEPVNERHEFVKRGNHHEELEAATFVIAGAFSSRANAERYSQSLDKLGFTADFGHLSARNIWYVFIAEEQDVEEAKKDRNSLQKNKIFKDVWLLTVHH